MDPPRSERRVDRWKGRKSVVVTFIVLEKVRRMPEELSFLAYSVKKRTSVWVVVQGRGQEEGWEPSMIFQ